MKKLIVGLFALVALMLVTPSASGQTAGAVEREALSAVAWKATVTSDGDVDTTKSQVATATGVTSGAVVIAAASDLTFYVTDDATTTTFRPITVTIPASVSTAAAAITVLNANSMFARSLLAENATAGIKLSTLAAGTKARFYVGASDVATSLGLAAIDTVGEAVSGATGTPTTVAVSVKDLFGNARPGAAITITLYNASTGSTKDTTTRIQNVSGAMVVTGYGTNTATIVVGDSGSFTFDIADTTGSSNTVYPEFTSTNGYIIVDGIDERATVPVI